MFRTINLESNKKLILLILDGWGISSDKDKSAIDQAKTPFYDSLINNYPNAQLLTHGESVGLPKGQMGNSEVGHMNIGAGRIVFQELAKINKEIETGNFRNNKKLNELVDNAISNQKKLAKVSKTPGKTKLFNFFKLANGYIVDFPGYGYSKVSKSQKKEWSKEIPKYFDMRKNLTGAVIFTDIRNPMRELDISMFEMLHQRGIPILIVLTKSDKVSEKAALEIYSELQDVFGYCLCFSIKDKSSIGDLVLSVNELLSS